MAKSVLGKGLGALMQENLVNEPEFVPEGIQTPAKTNLPAGIQMEEDGTLTADISLLVPNPHQPRTEFDPDALQELADSIREHGVLQPPTVEDAGNGTFYIIQGERRTRASRLAGLKRIPVILKKYSEIDKLEVALIENIQREDLNPIEEAIAYQKLLEIAQINQEELAQRVGKKRSTVANALRLLKLPEDMQNALASGTITAGHARALLSVNDTTDQRILFGRITGSGLSVREAEQQASDLNNGGRVTVAAVPVKKEPPKDPDIADLEQRFMEVFGTKVSLKGTLDKGSLVIEYFSKDDLDRLYDIIFKE